MPKSADAKPHEKLTVSELGTLPEVFSGVASPVLVAVTDQKNLARLVLAPALRKRPDGKGDPVPIVVLERIATFEGGPATTRLARARDVILFDGFRYDLDTAQVVPDGQGGDLQFVANGDGGPALVATGGAVLYTLARSPVAMEFVTSSRPSAGRAVLPADFAGRYRLYANGQMSGRLELQVADDHTVSGRFRSDQTGASYPVTGQAAAESPQRLRFAIAFPRSRQEFDGRLWTEGKGAMAGTMTVLNQEYGFFALREDGRYAPEDSEETPADEPAAVVSVGPGKNIALDGKPVGDAELITALKAGPGRRVVVRVPRSAAPADIERALALVRAAGKSAAQIVFADNPNPAP